VTTNQRHKDERCQRLGKTWVGATPPSGLSRSAAAGLVAPTHVSPETNASTEAVPVQD